MTSGHCRKPGKDGKVQKEKGKDMPEDNHWQHGNKSLSGDFVAHPRFLFLSLFIYFERERESGESERVGEGREKERESEADSILSAQSPVRGSNSLTVRS